MTAKVRDEVLLQDPKEIRDVIEGDCEAEQQKSDFAPEEVNAFEAHLEAQAKALEK